MYHSSIRTLQGTLAAAATAGLLVTGCASSSNQPVAGSEIIEAEQETRDVERILLAQAITGAGEDAMLYNHHFDGARLNSLGLQKLGLMLADAQFLADPHVYVVSGKAEQMDAVRSYLADWGIAFDDAGLHAGANPNTHRSAALGLSDRQKFEDTELRPSESGTTVSE